MMAPPVAREAEIGKMLPKLTGGAVLYRYVDVIILYAEH